MAELFDLLKNVLDDRVRDALAGKFGLGRDASDEAVGVGLPALLGGLSHHASQPDGAEEILARVRGTDNGKSLDDILDRLRSGEPDPQDDSASFVEKALGGVGGTGGEGGGILDALTSRLGLGKGVVGGLLGALLPMVLGSLGKLGGLGGLSGTLLRKFLGDGALAAADEAPGGRGAIAGLLGPLAGALGLGGAGATTAAAAVADAPPPPPEPPTARQPEPEDRERRGGAAPWWLLAAAVLALGVIIAFAAQSCGDDEPTATPAPTATETVDTGTTITDSEPAGDVVDETPARFLTARATGDEGVVLDGPVAADDTRTALVDGATTAFGAGKVDDQLRVEGGAGGPDPEPVEAVLGALAGAPRGWTAIWGSPEVLTLVGEVPTDADKAAIVAAATQAFAPGTVDDKLTVAAAGTPTAPAIDDINKEIRLRGVNFVTGSAELTPASRTTLDRIAAILADAGDLRAQVQGHTDNQGDAAANQALSARRAQAVVAYLAGKGIARNRLVPRGFGETRPVASNNTPDGRAKNRRVVFRQIS